MLHLLDKDVVQLVNMQSYSRQPLECMDSLPVLSQAYFKCSNNSNLTTLVVYLLSILVLALVPVTLVHINESSKTNNQSKRSAAIDLKFG